MDTEGKIRKLMRELDTNCPNCGSDAISIEKENDTIVGIMDELICSDCETSWHMISSVQTYFVQFEKEK